MAALMAAALIPATLCAQTADTSPPTAPATPAAPADQSVPPVAPAASDQSQAPVKLSPFEVSTNQEKGYFTPNTTAGTRLNNNIGDIPSSVTVIDKQQIQDTNSQNINDIMLYEANTQGSRTFTPSNGFVLSSGQMKDALAGNNDVGGSTGVGGADTLSTRIDGLGAPDNEVNNFYGNYRIPFDTYNVQSVEIDRGPNSLLFGSGSAAGIVNATTAQAQLDKLTGDVSLQAGSWGEFRDTADLNIPLIRNKVAIYLAQEFTSEGFQRRPANDFTRRQYAAITIDPFKSHKTRIVADVEFWNNYANDENSLTPYDEVTPWLAAGRPVMNPLTDIVTYLSTGKTEGPYVNSTTSPNYVAGEPVGTAALSTASAAPGNIFAPGITYASNHLTEFYANGNFLYAFQPAQTLGNNGLNGGQTPTVYTAAQQIIRQSQITNSNYLPIPGPGSNGAAGGYAAWTEPGVTSMSIYNWQNGPNTDASDYTNSKARTYHFDLQQNIFQSDKWGSLDAEVAFLRQEFRDVEVDSLDQHSPDTIQVDTNSYLLNGAANTYAGTTFIQEYEGDPFERPENTQNWRGSLVYGLDLRDKVPSWLKWLGHHRFMAEATTHDDVNRDIRYVPVINGGDGSYTSNLYQVNNQPVIPGNWSIQNQAAQPQYWQYLGTPGSTAVTQAPLLLGGPGFGANFPENATVTTYNYNTNQWVNSTIHTESVAGLAGATAFTENVQDQKTYFWQSFFWDDRIVGSVGVNDDIVKNRVTVSPPNSSYGATSNNPGLVTYLGGIYNAANTESYLSPWNPYTVNGVYSSLGEIGGNTYSEGFVARPLQNWARIDEAANNGNILAGFIRTLGFTFNKSDNFNPPGSPLTDLLGNPLPKPSGNEKDYGLEIATPDKKLYFRMTWFRATNQNNPVSSTPTARVIYIENNEMRNWARQVVEIRNGADPTNVNFDNLTVTPLTTTEQTQIEALSGLSYNYLFGSGGAPISGGYYNESATNSTVTGGYSAEITYNPLPNWTIKVTGGRQSAQQANLDSQAKAYLAIRMPYWLTVGAADLPNAIPNYKNTGGPVYYGSFWNSYGYGGDTSLTGGPGGGPTTVSAYYSGAVGIPILVESASQGAAVAQETPYAWNLLTNYTFVTGPARGLSLIGGLNWTAATIEGYYGDQVDVNSSGQVAAPNLNAPIYTPAQLHINVGLAYTYKLPWDDGRLRGRLQLNVNDLTSNGYLQAIQFNYDGSPNTFRIIQPRQFALTNTISF